MRMFKGFALLLLLLPGLAGAGRLTVEDEAKRLPAEGEPEELRAVAAAAPFDVLVIVTTKRGVEPQFSEYLASRVDGPRVVVLGIDPEHRKTALRYGTGTGLAKADADRALEAAKSRFRRADWFGGAAAALGALQRAPAAAPAAGSGAEEPFLPFGVWVVLGLGLVLLIVVVAVSLAQSDAKSESQRRHERYAQSYRDQGDSGGDSFSTGLLIGSMLPSSSSSPAPSSSSSDSDSSSSFGGGGSSGDFGGGGGFDGGGSSGDF